MLALASKDCRYPCTNQSWRGKALEVCTCPDMCFLLPCVGC
jgi:hypothetical protein